MFYDSSEGRKDILDDLKKLAKKALRETGEWKNRDFREAIGVDAPSNGSFRQPNGHRTGSSQYEPVNDRVARPRGVKLRVCSHVARKKVPSASGRPLSDVRESTNPLPHQFCNQEAH